MIEEVPQSNHVAEFTNQEVIPDFLPDALSVNYQKLAPSYRSYSLVAGSISFGLFGIILLIGLLLTSQLNSIMRVLAFFGAMILLYILRMAVRYFAYSKKGYALRQHDVLYRSGIWWKRHVFVPKNRIQHVEIKKTPLEDVFGISRLLIFTAGGSGSDLVIPGLLPTTAEQLKENLMQKIAHDQEE